MVEEGHVSAGEVGGSLGRILRRTLSPLLHENERYPSNTIMITFLLYKIV
jgi:hypothetical protein